MTRLEDFEKKLYKREEEESARPKNYELYKEDDSFAGRGGWEGIRRGIFFIGRGGFKVIAIGLAVVALGVFVGAGYYYLNTVSIFDAKKIKVTVSGPENIASGDEVSFSVIFKNETETALRDAELVFEWPEESVLVLENGAADGLREKRGLGVVLPLQEKTAIFKGRTFGLRGQELAAKVSFRYTPESVGSEYDGAASVSVKVVSVPLALKMDVPPQVVSEKELTFTLEYQNQSDAEFKDLSVKVSYPSGFNFISADPPPTKDNNIWRLNSLAGQSGGTIKFKGTISGAQGEIKVTRAELGRFDPEDNFISYASTENQSAIASSALMVFLTANDSRDLMVNPGTPLRYKINYKNTTDRQISNVVILANVDTSFVDIKTLDAPWGAFDARTNSMIWNSVGVPALGVLDPKEEGQVTFSVNVKKDLMPKSFSDKNLIVIASAKITSSASSEQLGGLPVEGEDRLETKINTQFSFLEKAYHRDGVIQNFGPIPPKVGERTTYAISWQLTNTLNDVEDVEVTASVPPGVEWTGVVYPSDADISYNSETGEVKWKAGRVYAGAGILTSAQKVDFQLAFTPALVHVGDLINLISEARLTGTDGFTGMKIERQTPLVNSDLLNSKEAGRVAQ